MRTGLLIGTLAAAAIAAAPPTSSRIGLHDLTGQFVAAADATAALPDPERAAAVKAKLDAALPGFYGPMGQDERSTDRLNAALRDFPALRQRYLAVSRTFAAAFATGQQRFRRSFPDYRLTVPVYLLHSLRQMDGGVRTLPDGPALIFGADVIARVHDQATVGPFLDHELFHVYHQRFFPGGCRELWCTLWVEGLAVYTASQLNPGATDRELLLTQPRPIRPEVEGRLPEVACFTLARLSSTDRQDVTTFFQGRGGDPRFPPRLGYYVGYRVAAAIGRSRSLAALARLRADEVRPLIEAALRSSGDCSPPPSTD